MVNSLRKFRNQFTIIAVFAFLTACTGPLVKTTEIVPDTNGVRAGSTGLTYMLPKQMVEIKLSRTFEKASTKPQADYDAAAEQLKTANSEAKAAKATRKQALDACGETGDTCDDAADELKIAYLRANADWLAKQRLQTSAKSKLDQLTANLLDSLKIEQHKAELVELKESMRMSCPHTFYNAECPAPFVSSPDSKCQGVLKTVNQVCMQIADLGGGVTSDPVVVKEEVEVKVLEPTGDTQKVFTASLLPEAYRDDKIKLEVNREGLLQSADLTAEDKSGAVITGVIKSVFYSMNLPSIPAPHTQPPDLSNLFDGMIGDDFEKFNLDKSPDRAELERALDKYISGLLQDIDSRDTAIQELTNHLEQVSLMKAQATCKHNPNAVSPFSATEQRQIGVDELTLVFDPSEQGSVAKLNQNICQAKFSSRISVESKASSPLTLPDTATNTKQGNGFHGLVYRRVTPFEIFVQRPLGNTHLRVPAWTASVSLPNGSPADGVEVNSAALVELKHDLKFVDGMLVSEDYDKPSEVAAGVQVVVDVVSLPFELVGKLLTLNINAIDAASKQTDLSQKQLELKDAVEESSKLPSENEQKIAEMNSAIELEKQEQTLTLLELQQQKDQLEVKKQIRQLENDIRNLEED